MLQKVNKRVFCSPADLVNLPTEVVDRWPELSGSAEQASFAGRTRFRKYAEWIGRLPPEVLQAIKSITDSGWWIANADATSATIGWPEEWVAPSRNLAPPASGQPDSPKQVCAPQDLDNFEAFARKAAMSPELAYLTIMALLYRQTKDPKVLKKFTESRERVDGHLAAIDKIVAM